MWSGATSGSLKQCGFEQIYCKWRTQFWDALQTENVKVFWGEFLAKSNEEWQIWALDGYEYILKTFCVWQKIKLFWLLQTGSWIHHNFIFDPPTIPPPDLCKCWQVQRNLNNMIREENGDYPYLGWALRPFLKTGGGTLCPPMFLRVLGGLWFQILVTTSYLTQIVTRQKDLQLSDT